MTFREDGPGIEGTWADGAVALMKFRSFVGSHGSRDGVTITLVQESGGHTERLRTWTKQHGEIVHRRA
ncbi:hypothetical protein ACFC0S_15825 [Streptomyces sp. NPDC056084]|uniref:hypothetical protein n=1 Tax=unclassified Streptomyces TaxID=2593676 RepID=UPI0035DBA247